MSGGYIEKLQEALIEACDIALGSDLKRDSVERIYQLRRIGQERLGLTEIGDTPDYEAD